nr:hypothetical protein [Tanacetum cinerariifolium]
RNIADIDADAETTLVNETAKDQGREKAQQIEEANLAWEDLQAKIKANFELSQRLQAEEQEHLTDAEKEKNYLWSSWKRGESS